MTPSAAASSAAPATPATGPSAAADAALEARVQAIATELRCLVCQNQTVADSNADLAQDLRRQVREMLKAGKSEREVLEFMTQRYGDFVLYRPPVKANTALLWAGPALILAGAAFGLWFTLRRRARTAHEAFEADPDSVLPTPGTSKP